ncbi:hypothetical protein HHK36_017018 [Tetracentron sinense]|uniref:Uncharacterized protein n=1 Tax=Tetracentron sinense TaxID=13715 RepID=A0A834Z6X7_TETSI|nr:hypothetical protein HHK36_017018 [Tetracentron sinense]
MKSWRASFQSHLNLSTLMFFYSCKRLLISSRDSGSRLCVFQYPFCCKSIAHISDSTNPPSFHIDYLINSCGVSPETALSAAKRIRSSFSTAEKPDSVLKFLESNGFLKPHITKLISANPRLLSADIERTLKPKIKLFQDLGLSGPKLAELIASNPSILLRSLNGQIIPCIQLVRSFVETDENVIKALKRSKWLLSCNPDLRMQPNIALLRDHNVPDSRIAHLIINQPGSLLLKTESLKETVESVEKLGFKPESGRFTIAIHTLCSMSKSTWEAKLMLLKDLGWSEEDIFSAFKKMPIFLACSENKMKEGMDFFVKMLKWDASFIAKHPKLLMYSLRKRVIPRFEIYKVLMSQGLLRDEWELIHMLNLRETDFMMKYVTQYDEEFSHLLKAYKGEESNLGGSWKQL